jgi:hypothetical protein
MPEGFALPPLWYCVFWATMALVYMSFWVTLTVIVLRVLSAKG